MSFIRTHKWLSIVVVLLAGCALAATLWAAVTDYPEPAELASYNASAAAYA